MASGTWYTSVEPVANSISTSNSRASGVIVIASTIFRLRIAARLRAKPAPLDDLAGDRRLEAGPRFAVQRLVPIPGTRTLEQGKTNQLRFGLRGYILRHEILLADFAPLGRAALRLIDAK